MYIHISLLSLPQYGWYILAIFGGESPMLSICSFCWRRILVNVLGHFTWTVFVIAAMGTTPLVREGTVASNLRQNLLRSCFLWYVKSTPSSLLRCIARNIKLKYGKVSFSRWMNGKGKFTLVCSYDFLYLSAARTLVVTVLFTLSSVQSAGINRPKHVT